MGKLMKKGIALFIVLVFFWLGINMAYPVKAATDQQVYLSQEHKNENNANEINEKNSSLRNKNESEPSARTKQKLALKDKNVGNNSTENMLQRNKNEGLIKKGQKTYYYKDDKKVKGLVKILGYYYLFSKKGTMLTGLRKTPKKKSIWLLFS